MQRINKVIASAFIGILSVGVNAHAYDSPNGKCYAEHVPGATTYDYVVYFENDRPRSGETNLSSVTGLSACVTELTNKLNAINLAGDTRILLLATTDKKASHAYNDQLSKRRLDIVKGLFGPKYSGKIITHLGGETNDNFTGTGNNRNPSERAVKILIANQTQINNIIMSSTTMNSSVKIEIGSKTTTAQASSQRIHELFTNLRNVTGQMDASVWKDKNGNFNTSRLISDSVAGVVLGTAGGLITSNIIKKNQLKSGFEDIKCTIGGQIVGEYGDDFQVGINSL